MTGSGPATKPGLPVAGTQLRSSSFRAGREDAWRELDELVTRLQKKGLKSLSTEELMRLPNLYRAAASALSVARATSLDRSLLDYLEALVARAYFAVYAPRRRPGAVLGEYLAFRIPAAMRVIAPHVGLAALVMLLGAALAWFLMQLDISWYHSVVPEAMAGGRTPEASTDSLRSHLYGGEAAAADQMAAFAGFLFSHNARIGLLAFALGALIGLPTVLLLFYNGLVFGAFVALHAERGLLFEVGGWLSIHGVTELAAVMVCGGAGLKLGQAMLYPGTLTRRAALVRSGKIAALATLGAVLMFFAAGLLEGFARQSVTSDALRYLIGWGIGAGWLVWFALGGRRG